MGDPARFTPIGVPASKARANSVIDALIEQLPPPGTDWPAEQRQAWLHMMETTFTLVYGGVAGGSMAKRSPASPRRSARAPAPAVKAKRQAPVKPRPPGPEFYIDRQGVARKAGGDPIVPCEVLGFLVDQRGEHGDLGTIQWADGSRGIPRGLQLDISADATPT